MFEVEGGKQAVLDGIWERTRSKTAARGGDPHKRKRDCREKKGM